MPEGDAALSGERLGDFGGEGDTVTEGEIFRVGDRAGRFFPNSPPRATKNKQMSIDIQDKLWTKTHFEANHGWIAYSFRRDNAY